MIKVSFIAIVLAAIGYKEYNPSVVGKWEHSKYPYYLEFFEDGTGLVFFGSVFGFAFSGTFVFSTFGDGFGVWRIGH